MTVWQQADDFIAGWRDANSATTIYCGAACASCCRLAVHATFPEAVVVAGALDQENVTALEAYVQHLLAAANELKVLPAYLRQHRQALGPCPFLSATGCCRIYAMRPLTCRALLATRPADWCGIDFSRLDPWDKRLFQQSLDRRVVTWPTHYVASTQDFSRQKEQALLNEMTAESGWCLSGNFPLMVWLERTRNLSVHNDRGVVEILVELLLDSSPMLALTISDQLLEG